MKTSTIRTCCFLLLLSTFMLVNTADAQRSKSKKITTEAPAYDDYEEYDQPADEGDKAAKTSTAPASSTAAPEEATEDEGSRGGNLFSLKNRLRLRTRPSPQPSVKAKPTLPSFIKHPANIEDLGHEHRHEPKPTEPPLPRPKPTTSRPHRFSKGTLRKKQTPPPAKEEPAEDYDDEEETADKRPAPTPVRKPLRPRRT